MNRPRTGRPSIVIVAAALILAAALAYVGYQLQRQNDKLWTRSELTQLIDSRLAERVPGAMSDEAFNQRVETGIKAYIRKQREARARASKTHAENLKPVNPDRDHIRGNPQARITLIEYSDFECPYCKRFHDTAVQLLQAYDGQVNWVYRHFPLSFHNPGAEREAEASECIAELGGNDAFWHYADAIYERTHSNGNGFPAEKLAPLAVEVGVDEAAFRKCLDSGRHKAQIQQDAREGQAAGVDGTPGNFLMDNATGRVVPVKGARPLDDLKAVVDNMLAQQTDPGSGD